MPTPTRPSPPEATGAGSRTAGTARDAGSAGRVTFLLGVAGAAAASWAVAALLTAGLRVAAGGTGGAAGGALTTARGRAAAGGAGGAVAAAGIEKARLQLKQVTGVPLGIAWWNVSVALQCGQMS